MKKMVKQDSIYLTPDLKAKLQYHAKELGLPMASLVRLICTNFFRNGAQL